MSRLYELLHLFSFWRFVLLGCVGLSVMTSASHAQVPLAANSASVERWVSEYLQAHSSLQGREYRVQWVSAKRALPACVQAPKVELSGKDRAWGLIFITLSCDHPKSWKRSIQLRVHVQGEYLVAARALSPGGAIGTGDWQVTQGALSDIPGVVVEHPDQVAGLEPVRKIRAGEILKLNDFQALTVIQYGASVKLVIQTDSFEVVSTGVALGAAAVGQSVRVRSVDGKTLQGKVIEPGVVEVLFQ